MPKPITAIELMSERPLWIDYSCHAWRGVTVRLTRLEPAQYIALSELYESYDRDEAGQVSPYDRYEWAVRVVAAHVTDANGTIQFASAESQQWLASEPAAVRELLRECMTLSGLGTVEDDAPGDAEKKSP